MMTIGYPQAIRSLAPNAEWTMLDVANYSTLQWFSSDVTIPTESQAQAEVVRLQSLEPLTVCSNEAKKRLVASDWSVLPDVNISNKTEFETYRAALRALVFTPVAEPTFPTEPQPIWV